MRNLARALGIALKYRWSLIAAAICSIVVALLWGANIGAVYPFVEVVFQGQSLHQWVDQRMETSSKAASEAEGHAARLEANLSQMSPAERPQVARQIQMKRALAAAERRKADAARQLQPHIYRWLPNDPYQTLVLIVVFLLAGTFVRCVFLMINMLLVARIGQRTMLDLQNVLFRRALQADLSGIGVRGTGDLVMRIRGETTSIANAVRTLLGKTLREPMKMAACLAGAAMVNWRLLLFSIAACPLAILVMILLARSTKQATRRTVEESARLMNRILQAITYLRVVKAFTMERKERLRFRIIAKDLYAKAMRISFYSTLARTNNEMVGIAIICLSVLAGGYLVLNEETRLLGLQLCDAPMTFGEMMVFFAFLIGIADPLRKMGDVYNMIQGGIVAADRVFPLYDRAARVANPQQPVAMPEGAPRIEFRQVDFSYRKGTPVLQGLNLRIKSGESLAIVGPNGCGKSTLIDLLPRFFDPDAGSVVVGKHDIRNYRLKTLRRQIGYVSQHTALFADTIANNIQYGSPRATRAQIILAARIAQADTFIQQLPQGYDTDVGEHGGKLSGGQRQRLALARAVLRNPSILILDEATSQIDPESESLIHRALREFRRGRTVILVTHRMSTLQLADRVAVMHQGQIVDCEAHTRLLARCDMYRRLWNAQMKEAA